MKKNSPCESLWGAEEPAMMYGPRIQNELVCLSNCTKTSVDEERGMNRGEAGDVGQGQMRHAFVGLVNDLSLKSSENSPKVLSKGMA